MSVHFLGIEGLKREHIWGLIEVAQGMMEFARRGTDLAEGRILSTVFYEPSTRTRLSFASAMNRLGGRVISFGDLSASSATKGEMLADAIRMLCSYSDIIAMRHPNEGAAKAMAMYSEVPIINAGDGGHEHPTQTMLDLLTIVEEKGGLDGIKVAAVGDLKHGRTVHSLAYALANFDATLVCVSPPGLEMPDYVVDKLPPDWLVEGANLAQVVGEADVLYVTRIQKERFRDPAEYEQVKGSYVVDTALLQKASPELIVLHPLPRVDEIAYDVDHDPRAKYFQQAFFGVPMRMAIISLLLGLVEGELPPLEEGRQIDVNCENPSCIKTSEKYLSDLANELGNCYYCGRPLNLTRELFEEGGE